MELILAAIGIILNLAGYGISEAVQGVGSDVRKKLTTIANQIYSKIGQNNQMLDKLYQAYVKKDSELANALITSAGFGAAATAIRNASKKNKEDYEAKKEDVTKKNIDLTNKYNEANQAIANAGNSIAGTWAASETEQQLNQAIQGGLLDEKKE